MRVVIGVAGLLLAAWAGPAAADMVEDCLSNEDAVRKIEGCTAMIDAGTWSGVELAAIYAHRCLAHSSNGEGELALADCDQAVSLAPEDPHTYAGRGDAHARLGDMLAAIEDYSAAIRLDPIYVNARLDRADALSALGQYELAVADYQQLLARGGITEEEATEVRGLRADALNRLAWALYIEGEPEAGLAHVEEALAQKPGAMNFVDTQASILCALGRAEDARAGFAQVIEAGGDDWARYYQQALTDFGYTPGPIDGLWGPTSQGALDAWLQGGCPLPASEPQAAAAEPQAVEAAAPDAEAAAE
jgi:tetratricopeptide (TPR) repeat protein